MKLSDKGAAFIKGYEKCVLAAYKPTPEDKWTIGWGHTLNVKEGDTCTQEQADAWFLDDVAWAEECVNRAVRVDLLANEFDALVSLCYNIGCPAFSSSTLVRLLNNEDFDGAVRQFARWDHQDGSVLEGLAERRAAEQQMFETAIV